jgi:secreted PhoX family phosphatase
MANFQLRIGNIMNKQINRRKFLSTSINAGVALTLGTTLLNLSGCSSAKRTRPSFNLVKDPLGICDLPAGFSYTVISKHGETMSDGHIVPDYHDGMGCFEGPNGELILVRNHEMPLYFPFDPESPAPKYAYDPKASGGTTTIWLNNKLEVTKHHLSLTGTIRNCSGGVTPWGTWISSEEAGNEGWMMGKRHGYNFEVAPLKPLELIKPLTAMGRFNHEAVAVDSSSGIAYQTEDDSRGCFYRFVPNVLEKFEQGGILQALKFVDDEIRHTTKEPLQLNKKYPCQWVTVDEPDPEENNVQIQAQAKGAAIFVRGEGVVVNDDGVYFSCSTGGAQRIGQFFKYTPNQDNNGGSIELVFEATKNGVLEKPDNITINQWGDLIICEDNSFDTQFLMGLTPQGKIYHIASNTQSEWSGACFSPDGKILFANIHKKPGMTLAIHGPWETLRTSV